MPQLLKNLLRGAGSILEILPAPRTRTRKLYNPPSSDSDALRQDWEKVGQDMWQAIDYEKS